MCKQDDMDFLMSTYTMQKERRLLLLFHMKKHEYDAFTKEPNKFLRQFAHGPFSYKQDIP